MLAIAGAPAKAAPTFPPLTGRVVDDAHLLNPADRAQLAAELKALEDKTSDQLVVVTLPSLQGYPIETFGYQLGRHWGIGTKKLNNGALLIVAPKEHKVRIEVGYGLEPVLTDALSRVIIDAAILPQFRKGDYAAGIKAGVAQIIRALGGDAVQMVKEDKQQIARRNETGQSMNWILFLVWILILVWILYNLRKTPRGPGGGGGWPIIFPGPGWGGGRRGGGFGGDGGFSGGGGSFGGGGASGSW